ncbi:MAG TPA: hypothetical protein VMD09_03205 [Solirubrobacteraceae bacterium]|nr:hypothetical protein [Solirubrobacteraceae bacterium]
MDAGLVVAVALAVAFALTNGFHDAANSIASLIATRSATPVQVAQAASQRCVIVSQHDSDVVRNWVGRIN